MRVHAISIYEPPLFENLYEDGGDVLSILEAVRPFQGSDYAYQVELFWELWSFDGDDWQLEPARVDAMTFGSEFERDDNSNLVVNFGPDVQFLPNPELEGSARLVHSNIQSLLRLVHELDDALPMERRLLETESGVNFAEKLRDTLGEIG